MQTTIFLAATDPARTSDLYDQLGFGLDSSRRRPGAPSTYVAVKVQTARPADLPSALYGRPVFRVDDLEAALRLMVEAGGTVLIPPTQGAGLRLALAADPDGNEIGLTDTAR